jgi:hypothetical protein
MAEHHHNLLVNPRWTDKNGSWSVYGRKDGSLLYPMKSAKWAYEQASNSYNLQGNTLSWQFGTRGAPTPACVSALQNWTANYDQANGESLAAGLQTAQACYGGNSTPSTPPRTPSPTPSPTPTRTPSPGVTVPFSSLTPSTPASGSAWSDLTASTPAAAAGTPTHWYDKLEALSTTEKVLLVGGAAAVVFLFAYSA